MEGGEEWEGEGGGEREGGGGRQGVEGGRVRGAITEGARSTKLVLTSVFFLCNRRLHIAERHFLARVLKLVHLGSVREGD